MFPLIVQMILVILPSLWGVRQGLRLASLPVLRRTILWACVLAAVTALGDPELGLVAGTNVGCYRPAPVPHLPSLLPIALLGPIGYWLATARWSTRRAVSDYESSPNSKETTK